MILLASLLIIIFIGLYYDYLFNNQSLSLVEIPIEPVKSNKCIFDFFIEIFKVNNSSYFYYPSHFTPINIIKVQKIESLPLLEKIIEEEKNIIKDIIKAMLDNLGTISELSN